MEMMKCRTEGCGFNLVIQDGPETRCPRCRKTYRKPEEVQETCVDCGGVYETIKFPVDFGFTKRCPKCQEKRDMDAEMAYELRGNFEPGSTVVNVFTGEKWVV